MYFIILHIIYFKKIDIDFVFVGLYVNFEIF